jgi:acyl-CoA thioester hydrolase
LTLPRRSFTTSWRVRTYELDSNGHVNNAVYLAYAEEVATRHAEALGFGRTWTLAQGGTWVVRRHTITYFAPATAGDCIELTTELVSVRGARGIRRTTMRILGQSGASTPLADVETEWVWLRASDMRPTRVPPEMLAVFGALA